MSKDSMKMAVSHEHRDGASRRVAFVHASNAVTTLDERQPLHRELIGNETLFGILLGNMRKCRNLDCITIVTSDNRCDNWFCETALLADRGSGPGIDILRVPADSPYAFIESNRKLDSTMLYRIPMYGLLSAEGFLSLTKDKRVECAIVIDAESSTFISPQLLDSLVQQCGKNGEMIVMQNPRRSIIAASPRTVTELFGKHFSEMRNGIATRHEMARKEIDCLAGCSRGGQTADLEQLLKRKIGQIAKQSLTPLEALFTERNSEERTESNIKAFAGRERSLLNVSRGSDIQRIRFIFNTTEKAALEQLSGIRDEFTSDVKNTWPAYLSIELTSACSQKCNFCPNHLLERPRGCMDETLFNKIIDDAATHSAFISIGGYGEPTLHPNLTDFVRYAKGRGIIRMALETNARDLNPEKAADIFGAGLDFLIINLNALMDSDPVWENRIDAFVAERDKARGLRQDGFPMVILQAVNSNSMSSKLDYIFAKYDFIVDRIVILPFDTFNGRIAYDGVIDFTPIQRTLCRKLMNGLFVSWDGKASVCAEFFDKGFPSISLEESAIKGVFENQDVEEFIKRHREGDLPEQCSKCRQWYLLDFQRNKPEPWFSLMSELCRERHAHLLESLVKQGDKHIERSDSERAFECWEQAMKHDPGNPSACKRLMRFACGRSTVESACEQMEKE